MPPTLPSSTLLDALKSLGGLAAPWEGLAERFERHRRFLISRPLLAASRGLALAAALAMADALDQTMADYLESKRGGGQGA